MDASVCRGSLLGLAIGDALGYCIDGKTWAEICAAYGPNGLLGYDLMNGTADVTSYTQIAAFVLNGFLLANTRGKRDYLPYITLSLREWARNQYFYHDPEKSVCWIAKPKLLRLHNNRDARMLDALRLETLGTPDAPRNRNTGAGALTAAVAVALFGCTKKLPLSEIGRLAAQTAALTHGDAETFLSAAALALTVASVIREPAESGQEQALRTAESVLSQFGGTFPQAAEQLANRIRGAVALSGNRVLTAQRAMEELNCFTAAECLAGGIYAAIVGWDDFDTAMITAVNHSGMSSAVGAVTGAIMGARCGADALPEFYLEGLGCAPMLSELAGDAAQGSPTAGLFDDDWDQKYVQGMPLGG